MAIVDCLQGIDLLQHTLQFNDGGRKHNFSVMALIGCNHALKRQIFSIGASDYITSPVITEELLTRINTCCNHFDFRLPFIHPMQSMPMQLGSQYRGYGKERQLVDCTCHYLLEHLDEEHGLDTLAQKMATNRNTLACAFKRVMGMGVFVWLREQRMKKAQIMLKTTQLSIQHICYEVGYKDPANFSTAFKTRFNLAPKQYRDHNSAEYVSEL